MFGGDLSYAPRRRVKLALRCRERKGGPSEAEIQKKKDEANKDRPFSNPDRQGGTQVGPEPSEGSPQQLRHTVHFGER